MLRAPATSARSPHRDVFVSTLPQSSARLAATSGYIFAGSFAIGTAEPDFGVITARSELRKVLLLALSVTFLFVSEISRELLNGFA